MRINDQVGKTRILVNKMEAFKNHSFPLWSSGYNYRNMKWSYCANDRWFLQVIRKMFHSLHSSYSMYYTTHVYVNTNSECDSEWVNLLIC